MIKQLVLASVIVLGGCATQAPAPTYTRMQPVVVTPLVLPYYVMDTFKADCLYSDNHRRFLEERINKKGRNPTSFGESLTGNLAGLWRYKVGDYRLICDIQKDILVVLILEADHRKQVYRKVKKS